MQRKMITVGVVACVLALVIAGLSIAQPPARGNRQGAQAGPGQRGPGQRGGQFDPAQMRERMMDRMREQLGASETEWKVIEPRLTTVMELSRETSGMGRGGMMFGGFGGRGPRGANAPGGRGPQGQPAREMTEVEKATDALRTTLENQSASPEQIKSQLTALRSAREKARQKLAVAQQELRQILTMRQEAQMVLMGLLS